MSNNPISNVDPNGDSPMLIGAAIGFLSNGIQNIASGNNFFQGGFKAAFIGAWGGGVSAGIGSAFGNVSGLGNEVLRAGAHGVSGGLQSMAGGGSFGSGFLSGGISSGVGSGISALGGGATAQWAGGGLSGGIGSVIGGGNFFQGAGMGLAVGGLNHAVNHILSGDPTIVKTEKKNGFTINYYDDGTITTWGPGGSLSITDAKGQTRIVFRASGAITSTGAPWEYLMGGQVLGKGFSSIKFATGGLYQWVRIGPSYSIQGDFATYGLRWGASPKHAWKIGNSFLRKVNQYLRKIRIKVDNWKFKDAGHWHFKKK